MTEALYELIAAAEGVYAHTGYPVTAMEVHGSLFRQVWSYVGDDAVDMVMEGEGPNSVRVTGITLNTPWGTMRVTPAEPIHIPLGNS